LQNPLTLRDATAFCFTLFAGREHHPVFPLARAHFARAAIMIACSNQATRAAIKIKLENGSGGPLASLRLSSSSSSLVMS